VKDSSVGGALVSQAMHDKPALDFLNYDGYSVEGGDYQQRPWQNPARVVIDTWRCGLVLPNSNCKAVDLRNPPSTLISLI
jgi:hypothetical protein